MYFFAVEAFFKLQDVMAQPVNASWLPGSCSKAWREY
jgi:hypothetical protein